MPLLREEARMKLAKENLWTKIDGPAAYIVTTNGYIRKDGALVMGRGAALEATKRIPGIEYQCGDKIQDFGYLTDNGYRYGFLVVRLMNDLPRFGIFQVKYHFKDNADLNLILHSVTMLKVAAEAWNDIQFRMNFPGIGWGHLKREDVLPLLQGLPNNVTICYK
jgi:hypothetical protein